MGLCSLLALLPIRVLPWGWNPLTAGRFLDVSVSVHHLHGGGDTNYTYTWLKRRKLHVSRKKEALVAVFVTMYATVYGFCRKFAHCCLSYDRSTASTKESSLR